MEILRRVGGGGLQKPKFLKEGMRLNWNFQRTKKSSIGGVWIFSGTPQFQEVQDSYMKVTGLITRNFKGIPKRYVISPITFMLVTAPYLKLSH